jgi:cellulose synthase/poly-beta-1,6-N-acetylglucosamine synthase-like glycosyltransferase
MDATTKPVPVETTSAPLPRVERRALTPLLLLGYFLTIGVGCAQVYFLVRAISGLPEGSELSYFQSVVIAFFFFFFSVFFIGRYLVTMLFAFLEGSKHVDPALVPMDVTYKVSIVIPAFNEEDNIAHTIESAVAVNYPQIEVIVVDDGSTDGTLAAARACAARQALPVTVVTQSNGGKSSALNHGFRISDGDFVLCMDADSELAPDSVWRLVYRSVESGAGAVAGQVRIKNTRTMLSYLQQLEYVLMNGTSRLFQSFFSSVLVAPGPITLFRRDALERTLSFRASLGEGGERDGIEGPWQADTFAEDAKLTMTLLATGERAVFEPAALCMTQAPARLSGLLNQRYRWIRGNLQAIKSTWYLWTGASSRRPGLGLWLAWFIIESVLWPLIDVFGAVVIVLVLANTSAFSEGLLWYLALMSADVAAALFAATACSAGAGIALFVPFYRIGYGLLLECVAIVSLLDEWRRARMAWA